MAGFYFDSNGNTIPDNLHDEGVPYLTLLGLHNRLYTKPGAFPNRPDYGLDLSEFIDRPLDLDVLRLKVNRSLKGLYGFISATVTMPDPLVREVKILVTGYTNPFDLDKRPWEIAFAVSFG